MALEWTLIARYLAGDASPSERVHVERTVAPEELDQLRRVWEQSGAVPSRERLDAMWTRLSARMHSDAIVAPRRHTPPRVLAIVPPAPRRRRWQAAAALLAAGVVLAVGISQFIQRDPPTTVASVAADSIRTFATDRGQRATIRLSDGTKVELGYASRLRVRPLDDGGRREMWLEGEAVFDVVHDSTRPFIVHAANATTEDLGTTFGVRAYPGDSAVRVVVVEGLVAMRPRVADSSAGAAIPNAGQGTVIRPGHAGRLDARGQIEVVPVDTTKFAAWLVGRIAFDNAPLDEIAAELSRRFDVDVRIADPSLARKRITVHAPATTLAEVLDVITIPLGVGHRRDGGVIVLGR